MGFRVPDTLLISDYLHATWLCSQSDQEKKKKSLQHFQPWRSCIS